MKNSKLITLLSLLLALFLVACGGSEEPSTGSSSEGSSDNSETTDADDSGGEGHSDGDDDAMAMVDYSGQTCGEIKPAEKDGLPDLGGCTLTIAIENAYNPFNFIDVETGEAIGYDYDIFTDICELIHCEPNYIETSWDAIVAIMGGEGDFSLFDVGADGITITPERAEFVDFSKPYIQLSQVLLVRSDEDRFAEASELKDNADWLLGSTPGTTNYDTSAELVGEDRIVSYDQFGTAVQALMQGDIDGVVMDNVAGIGYVGANPDAVKITGSALTSEELGFIFSKGSSLTGAVDSAIAELDNNGRLGELFDKWFVTEEGGDASDTTEAAMVDFSGMACGEIEPSEKDGLPNLGGCTLNIAIENAYNPFNFIDVETGEAIGYDYDIFAEVCGMINCEPNFVETSWDAIVAIMGGEGDFSLFDVGADGITITPERAEFVDFSDPYIQLSQVLLVRSDEDRFKEATDLPDNKDWLLGSTPGTTNYDTSAELVGEDRIVAYDQFGTAVQALIQGDIDGVIMDNVAGIGYVGANPDAVKITGSALTSEELGFIFSKGSPLTNAVNRSLVQLDNEGVLDELFNKWFATEE